MTTSGMSTLVLAGVKDWQCVQQYQEWDNKPKDALTNPRELTDDLKRMEES